MVTEAFLCYYSWFGGRKGREKKKLKKGALHLNDGLVHRPVSPVWQETLSSWSAVTLVCRGQVRECVNTLITEPGNGFFAPLCSRNMSSVCGENCYVWLNASLMDFSPGSPQHLSYCILEIYIHSKTKLFFWMTLVTIYITYSTTGNWDYLTVTMCML